MVKVGAANANMIHSFLTERKGTNMGKLLGEAAGFAMLLLIWILFLNMLKELNLIRSERMTLIRKVSLYLWGAGIVYLVLGGFFYNISVGSTSIFQYDVVWGYGNYGRLMEQVENEKGNGNGLFSMMYLLAARGIGTLFFKQYISGAVYTSFFFAIAFGVRLYDLFLKGFGSQKAQRLLLLVFVFPFSYKLFLPSPASLVCWLIVMALGSMNIKISKIKTEISHWSYLFFLVILTSVNIMLYYKEMLLRK